MGGTDYDENLIDLFAREHFEAHRLLALENPKNKSLTYAWACMTWLKAKNQERINVSSEQYEEARIAYSKMRSQNIIGENNYFYGRHHTEETKEKIRQANLGRKMSECARIKISEANHKREITSETREKLRKINLGKKMSAQTKRKISESKKGVYVGEKNPNYNNHKLARENNPNAKTVCQFDLDFNILKIWNFIKEASEILNIGAGSISACCQRREGTSGGYRWCYLYDQTKRDGTIIQGAISLGLVTEDVLNVCNT